MVDNSFFCSQLIAEAYQRMGLLSRELPSNAYLPVDFVDPSPDNISHAPGTVLIESFLLYIYIYIMPLV